VRRLGLFILYFILFASIGIALLTLVLSFAMSNW
jgi:hypothetical protein